MQQEGNKVLGILYDITASTQNTIELQKGERPVAGQLLTFDGKVLTTVAEKAAGICGGIGAIMVGGKPTHQFRFAPSFSAGRVSVNCIGAVAGAKAYYKIATSTYEKTGNIEVGTFYTTGDGLQVVQIKIVNGA